MNECKHLVAVYQPEPLSQIPLPKPDNEDTSDSDDAYERDADDIFNNDE